MDNNYTPINLDKLKNKENGLNTVLLFIVTLTALVLAIMLFILIQRKINSLKNIEPIITPTVIPQPTSESEVIPTLEPTTETASPTAIISPSFIEATITPEASPTSNINQ